VQFISLRLDISSCMYVRLKQGFDLTKTRDWGGMKTEEKTPITSLRDVQDPHLHFLTELR